MTMKTILKHTVSLLAITAIMLPSVALAQTETENEHSDRFDLLRSNPYFPSVEDVDRIGLTTIGGASLIAYDQRKHDVSELSKEEVIEKLVLKYHTINNRLTMVAAGKGGYEVFSTILQNGIQNPMYRTAAVTALPIIDQLVDKIGSLAEARYKKEQTRVIFAIAKNLNDINAENFNNIFNDEGRINTNKLKEFIPKTGMLQYVRSEAERTGDLQLYNATTDALVNQTLDLGSLVILKSLETEIDLEKTRTEFSEIAILHYNAIKELDTEFSKNRNRINNLSKTVTDLGETVGELQVKMKKFGGRQDVLVDFMIARITPDEKLRALQTGLMDHQFKCPVVGPDCDKNDEDELRSLFKEKFEKEKEITSTLTTIATVTNNLNSVLKIATDLGIDVPSEVVTAMTIINAGVGAAISFFKGDILGGISALTGLISGKKDPHLQMMEFMSDNFNQINETLIEVHKLQVETYKAVIQVSEQIHRMHVDLDAGIRALDFRLDMVDQGIRNLIWAPWKSCHSILHFAKYPKQNTDLSHVDRQSLFFHDLQSRLEVINDHEDLVLKCRVIMKEELLSITSPGGWDRFGAVIDLQRSLLNLSSEQVQALKIAERQKGVTDYRSNLEKHLDFIVRPSSNIVRIWATEKNLDYGTLLYLLAAEPETIDELELLLDFVFPEQKRNQEGWRFTCNPDDERYYLIGAALCRADHNERNRIMETHLTSALDSKALIDLSEWAIIGSQIFDLYDGARGRFARTPADIEIIASSAGKPIISTLAPLMSLGIAYENRLHGGLTARIIADRIKEQKTGVTKQNTDAHKQTSYELYQKILRANPYMAENVALILLDDAIEQKRNEHMNDIPLELRYAQAIAHARSDEPYFFSPLNAIFGDHLTFKFKGQIEFKSEVQEQTESEQTENRQEIDRSRTIMLVVNIHNEEIGLPIPGPRQLVQKRFVLPVDHNELHTARARVVKRMIDYELGEDTEMMKALSNLLQQ